MSPAPVVYGQDSLLPGTRRYPLELDGRPIGSLAVLAGPPVAGVA